LRPIRNRFVRKYDAELAYWQGRHAQEHGQLRNGHYERTMLAMAGESTQEFVRDKIVADFGCGPRGSLAWMHAARMRIGIDVLVDRYADAFGSNLTAHGMIYVKSTERVIPMPSEIVDVVFTLNALDHVDDLAAMCDEIMRILRPGGLLVGGFNLGEPATPSEPQRLDEHILHARLLSRLETRSYRITRKGPPADPYAPFFAELIPYQPGDEGLLWVTATKPS
jgi:SAM-dependent methyltransferase